MANDFAVFKRHTDTKPGHTNHASRFGINRTLCGKWMRGGKHTHWVMVVNEPVECETCAILAAKGRE